MAELNQPEVPRDECADRPMVPDNHFDAERAHLRMVLDEVAAEVAVAMQDAGFSIKVLFTSPADGEALLNFATDIDPHHENWPRVRQIICNVVGTKIGMKGLRCRCVGCAATAHSLGAADVAALGDDEVRRVTESSSHVEPDFRLL